MYRLPMGPGSCRVLLEQPDVLHTFDVRALAPDVPLLANLGAVQLNQGVSVADCRAAGTRTARRRPGAAPQPVAGSAADRCNTRFSGLFDRIRAVCAGLDAPVIVKEVGWGIADDLVVRLLEPVSPQWTLRVPGAPPGARSSGTA